MLVQRGHGIDHNDCLLGRPRPGRQQTFWLLLRHERERTDRPAGDCRDGRDPRASNRQLERCCFAASEQHYLPPRRSHHDAAPARHAEARALRAPSGSCVSRPSRQRHGGRRALLFSPGAALSATGMPMPGNAPRRGRRDVCELYGVLRRPHEPEEGSPNARRDARRRGASRSSQARRRRSQADHRKSCGSERDTGPQAHANSARIHPSFGLQGEA